MIMRWWNLQRFFLGIDFYFWLYKSHMCEFLLICTREEHDDHPLFNMVVANYNQIVSGR